MMAAAHAKDAHAVNYPHTGHAASSHRRSRLPGRRDVQRAWGKRGPAPGTGHQPDPSDVSRAASSVHFANGVLMNYVINTRANAGQTAKAARAAQNLGATIVAAYPELGVVVAQTSMGSFRQDLLQDPKNYFIDSAGATRREAVDPAPDNGVPGVIPPVVDPVAGVDKLEPLQWDKVMIGADKSREINAGSDQVLVAILDSGVDDRNPDIAGRIDVSA